MSRFLMLPFLAIVVCFSLFSSSRDAFAYSLANNNPETIPLWGLAWGTNTVNVRVSAGHGVTVDAINATKQALTDWNAAIAEVYGTSTFHIVDVTGTSTKPHVTIQVKTGGGMVQGQALASDKNHDGLFDSCKVNVSGMAFGSTNDPDTVRSIALQEFGHCLGLLHADNSDDVMYGTLQSPPNTVISTCDVAAWAAVMDWLIQGVAPHRPTVSSVYCP